jgi:hypothetical protein
MREWKQKVTKKNNLAGSGKSSLIRSIVQACDDIVHVDPMPALSSGWSGSTGSKSGARHTRGGSPVPIAEIYAFFGGGRVTGMPYWNGIFALLIHYTAPEVGPPKPKSSRTTWASSGCAP